VDLQDQDRFHVHQKPTLMFKRFRIFLDDGKGRPGELAAFVQQDRGSLKERVVVYRDEARETPLVEFGARSLLEGSDVVDVRTPAAEPLGVIRKSVGRSFVQSTWMLEPEGRPPLVVTERSRPLAIVRRGWRFLPVLGEFPFPVRHALDMVRDGREVGSVRKTARLDDEYLVQVDDPELDRRLVLAAGVVFGSG
jgi:hypothetical protein